MDDEKREALRKIFLLDNISNVDVKLLREKAFHNVGKRRQDEYTRMVSALFCSIIHISSTNDTKDSEVFTRIVQSDIMHKFLKAPSPIPPLLTEIVKSYNSAENYNTR